MLVEYCLPCQAVKHSRLDCTAWPTFLEALCQERDYSVSSLTPSLFLVTSSILECLNVYQVINSFSFPTRNISVQITSFRSGNLKVLAEEDIFDPILFEAVRSEWREAKKRRNETEEKREETNIYWAGTISYTVISSLQKSYLTTYSFSAKFL